MKHEFKHSTYEKITHNLCMNFITKDQTPFLYALAIGHVSNYIFNFNAKPLLKQLKLEAKEVTNFLKKQHFFSSSSPFFFLIQ